MSGRKSKPAVGKPLETTLTKVRLDQWLWAARFFKTRAQAKAAITGGKVEVNGARPKVSKEVEPGMVLSLRRSWVEEVVVIKALATQRGRATIAQTLYEETAESIERRETEVARRRMERAGLKLPQKRPSKRDRRSLLQMKDQPSDNNLE